MRNYKALVYVPTVKMSKRSASPSEDASKKQKINHWSFGLVDTIKDPTNHVQSDDLVITIKDKFPKAEFHYLVLPKENIKSLKVVTTEHIPLIEHMNEVAKQLMKENHPDTTFRVGFHAEPSMSHLHLHVISDDMNSPCLKTKKHWNSYTTKFLLELPDVIKQLREEEKVTLPSSEDCKKWLNLALKCHKCEYKAKHIPDLKKHIAEHFN